MSISKIERRYTTAKYTLLNRIVELCTESNYTRTMNSKINKHIAENTYDIIIQELSEIYREMFDDNLFFEMNCGYYHFIETDEYKILIEKGVKQ